MFCRARSVITIAGLGLILLMVACSPTLAASPAPTSTLIPTPVRPPTISEAEIAGPRAEWNAERIVNYNFNVALSCFCFFEHGDSFTVTVLNGETKAIRWEDGTTLTNADAIFPSIERVTTIDRMFNEIERARTQAAYVKATFDPAYGFPTSFYIDNNFGVADDEIGYTISNFALTQPVEPTPVVPRDLPRTGGHP